MRFGKILYRIKTFTNELHPNLIYLILIFDFLFLAIFLINEFQLPTYKRELHQVSHGELKSPIDFKVPDQQKTTMLKVEATDSVPLVISFDPSVQNDIMTILNELGTKLKDLRDTRPSSKNLFEEIVKEEIIANPNFIRFDLTVSDVDYIIKADRIETSFSYIKLNLETYFSEGIVKDIQEITYFINKEDKKADDRVLVFKNNEFLTVDLVNLKNEIQVIEEFIKLTKRKFARNRQQRQIIINLIENSISANLNIDLNLTKQKEFEASEKIAMQYMTIKKDQAIIRDGDIVNQSHIEIINTLNKKIKHENRLRTLVGIVILTMILVMLLYFHIVKFEKNLLMSVKPYIAISLVFIILVIISHFILVGEKAPEPMINGYAIPVSVLGIIISLLLNSQIAILCIIIFGLYIGMMSGFNLNYLFYVIVIGITSIYATTRLRNRNDLFNAYLIIFGSTAVTCFALGFANNYAMSVIFTNIANGLFGGIIGIVLVMGLLTFFEEFLDMSTDIKLLELCDLNHPLLKDLAAKASGSFQHSLIVGNLAEAVADRINARGPLAKAGGYFHDIGKLKNPIFFIENQRANFNPHDKLKPEKSAKILSDHVLNGVQLAIEYNLPTTVINIIKQHQGNTKMKAFYKKALRNGGEVNESLFRYRYSKPQTKEAAIVMLCDNVEAKTRLFDEPTEENIEKVISDTFQDLMVVEKQLDEVDLTLKDLNMIKQVLKETLISFYHARIDY